MVRPGHSPVLAPVWVAAVASSATRSPAPALCGRYPDVIALPLLGRLLPPACAGPGRTARPDAGDADVLVDPLAGADAVVAVGDDERMHAVGGDETQVYSMAETLQVHTGAMGMRRVQVGCEFVHVAAVDTPAVFQIEPQDAAPVSLARSEWSTEPELRIRHYTDLYGNLCARAV